MASAAASLRILWCASWFGGLDERYAEALVGARSTASVTLLCTDGGLTTVRGTNETLVLPRRIRDLRNIAAVARALTIKKHDVAILDDTWDPRFILCWLARARRRVLVVHDVDPHDDKNVHKWGWQRVLKGWVRRSATHVICFSRFTETRVRASGRFRTDVGVCVLALLPEVNTHDHRGSPTSPLTFLLVGRISRYKNVTGVLRAWSQFVAANTDAAERAELVIAGPGAAGAVADAGVHIGDITVVDGQLNDDELVERIATSAAVIAYYERATQSGIVSLASALGVPVIVSRAGGLHEYQPNPELTAASESSLARALADLVGPLQKDYAERAWRFGRQTFDPVVIGEELARFLESL